MYGTAVTTAEAVPFPMEFTAYTRYEYAEPFVKPVNVAVVPEMETLLTVVHVIPPSVVCSTT